MMQSVEQMYEERAREQNDEQSFDSNICWFCESPKAEKAWAAEIFLNKYQNTHFGLTGSTSKYLLLNYKISCCQICHRTHKKENNWCRGLMLLGGIIGFISGLILPFVIVSNLQIQPDKDFNGIVCLFIVCSIVLGAIFGYLLGQKIAFSTSPETKPRIYAKQHPLIIPLIQEGWIFGKPTDLIFK
jgi:hypothetical protein